MPSSLPLCLLLSIAQSPTPAAAVDGRGGPAFTPPRIEASIEVDGSLDEPAWDRATRLTGFSQYQPSDSRPAQEQTDVLVWYAPDAIYFGIVAHDSDPSSIRATVADRDNLGREDSVTIYLDTFNDRRRAFFFAVNPLGAQQDGVFSEGQGSAGHQFGGTEDTSPDYRFDSKGRLTADGYVVEVRIPFKSLRYPGGDAQTWGINVKRKIQRSGYEDTWTDARRISSFLAQAGRMQGLHDLKRGVVTEVQPFVTGANAGTRRDTGSFVRGSTDFNAGVNARLGFTNISLDATIKPDFSQVESDAGLVTINERFALFIPEKRPFFLEGIELFSTPNQLVYTRQIVSPLGGAKITGKFGAFGIAHLTAFDDTDGEHALFNVTRIRRDIGTSSVAGVTYTDRTADANFNRVLAADARIVFAKLYYVLGQVGGSWTGEQGAATRTSPIWSAEFDRTARHWGFNYKLNGIGEDFETRAGFVPRDNIVEGHAMNRFSYYGPPGAALESLTTFFGPSRIWRFSEFGHAAPIEGEDSVRVTADLRGGWQLEASPARNFVRFDPADYVDYRIVDGAALQPYVVPATADNQWSVTTSVTTPTWQRLNGEIELLDGDTAIFPEATAGHERRWTATLGLRPTSSVRLDLTAVRSVITRARDGSEFARTTLPRLKIEFQPRRSLFFRMVAEYRSERQAALIDPGSGAPIFVAGVPAAAERFRGLQLDWLVSYEPTPGTAAYFGYGSALERPFTINPTEFRRASDAFFLKLAYQITR
jgi:hypothetical protein